MDIELIKINDMNWHKKEIQNLSSLRQKKKWYFLKAHSKPQWGAERLVRSQKQSFGQKWEIPNHGSEIAKEIVCLQVPLRRHLAAQHFSRGSGKYQDNFTEHYDDYEK